VTLAIGIDLGTSGIKCVILEDATVVVGQAARQIATSIPVVGWSEQDADDWVSTVFSCLDELAQNHPDKMASVVGIGLSGQMLSALLLDKDQKPVRPAILWNDQRAIAECAELEAKVPDIGRRTNGTPDPGLTAPKLLWLAKHEPQVLDAARMLLLTKDYVRLALTGEIASEPTDAGGTQLLDCATGKWDAQLCEAAGWDMDHLPPLTHAWEPAGGLRPALAERWGLKPNLPVAAGAGDNMGSTLGAGAATPGDAVLSIGTSGVACMVDDAFHPGPECAILTSAHAAPDTFLSMGVVMSATASLDWTSRMGGIKASDLAGKAETFATNGSLSDAPVFLPCLNGIRTPANRPSATGRMEGLHPGVDIAMLGYATLEGVAFQFADSVVAQRSVGVRPERFLAVGGGTRSELWLRLLATAINETLTLPKGAENAGPAGAARLAMVASGQSIDLLARPLAVGSRVEPDSSLKQVLHERKLRFDRLMETASEA
jgi:xylulokinase